MENRNEQLDEDLPTVCSSCGAAIDPMDWHPTRTRTADDGGAEIHVFCDRECLEEWSDG